MRKILTALFIFLLSAPAFAYENYMLMADKKISNIQVSNEDILSVEHILSVKCEGSAMMIIPHSVGSTRVSFCKGNKKIRFVVRVLPNKTCIKRINGIKLISIDLPPELR